MNGTGQRFPRTDRNGETAPRAILRSASVIDRSSLVSGADVAAKNARIAFARDAARYTLLRNHFFAKQKTMRRIDRQAMDGCERFIAPIGWEGQVCAASCISGIVVRSA